MRHQIVQNKLRELKEVCDSARGAEAAKKAVITLYNSNCSKFGNSPNTDVDAACMKAIERWREFDSVSRVAFPACVNGLIYIIESLNKQEERCRERAYYWRAGLCEDIAREFEYVMEECAHAREHVEELLKSI